MKTNKRLTGSTVSFLFGAILLPAIAMAAEWQVIPIRLDLDRGTKSGVLTIKNRGDESLNIQNRVMEWTQDAEGKDLYTESSDLILLPKLATIDKGEEQVIRVGIKIPATAKEKTYRVFVEEIPKPRKAEGSNVALAIRFGVPVFASPVKEEVKGEIAKVELAKGSLTTLIKNSGNVHFNITSLTVRLRNSKGEEIFFKDNKGWYLLSGAGRSYSLPVQEEACLKATTGEIEVKTDKLNLKAAFPVSSGLCRP